MTTTLYVALGGALGTIARYWVAILAGRLLGTNFPWGVLIINVSGSLVIGLFAALTWPGTGRFEASLDARAFVMIGICGGFTTFSSFSLQTFDLIRDGRLPLAILNVVLSVVLCLAAVAAGHYAGTALSETR